LFENYKVELMQELAFEKGEGFFFILAIKYVGGVWV
jgi:hypothetical protein